MGGWFNEILVCDDNAGDLTRLNDIGAAVDTHDTSSINNILGRVDKAWFQDSRGRATLYFSKEEEGDKAFRMIQERTLRSVSVGYNVYQYEDISEDGDKIPTYRAIKWEAVEISPVPVPADPDAGFRSGREDDLHNIEIISKNADMTKEERAAVALAERQRSAKIIGACRAAGFTAEYAEELISSDMDESGALSAIEAKRSATPAPAGVDADAIRKEERIRASGIRKAVKVAGLQDSYAESLIEGNMTLEAARAAIIDKAAEEDPIQLRGGHSGIRVGKDAQDKRVEGATNSILSRTGFKLEDGKIPDAGEFRGMQLVELAREFMQGEGIATKGLSRREIAEAAVGMSRAGGALATSDFPNLLANVFHKVLRRQYELQERTFLPWTRASVATDFKQMSRIQFGDLKFGAPINEGGEYAQLSMGDAAEKYTVAKYGGIVKVTWETLLNDDLSAFDRTPMILAQAAAQKQGDIIYGILSANAAMSDGNALFHAKHGNLIAASDLTQAALQLAFQALRQQTSMAGNFLNLQGRFIVTGPAKEMQARQLTSANYQPVTQGTVNVFGPLLTPIIDARISDNSSYIMAAPSQIDTIEYAFLDGEEIFTQSRWGFETDGLEIKARMVFGAKSIDWRGIVRNPGA